MPRRYAVLVAINAAVLLFVLSQATWSMPAQDPVGQVITLPREIAFTTFDPTPQRNSVKVDARQHCIYLMGKGDSPGDGAVRINIDRRKRYTIKAEGEVFFSDQKGRDADPMPGVILYYPTSEQDGYATQWAVLKSGDSLTFDSALYSGGDDMFVLAFFLDAFPASDNRGAYTLTVTEEAVPLRAVHFPNANFRGPVDFDQLGPEMAGRIRADIQRMIEAKQAKQDNIP